MADEEGHPKKRHKGRRTRGLLDLPNHHLLNEPITWGVCLHPAGSSNDDLQRCRSCGPILVGLADR